MKTRIVVVLFSIHTSIVLFCKKKKIQINKHLLVILLAASNSEEKSVDEKKNAIRLNS